MTGNGPKRSPFPWQRLLVAIGLGCVVYVCLGVVGDFGDVRAQLGGLERWAMPAALSLALTNYLLRFLKWQYYLRLLGVRIPVGSSLSIHLAGLVMSVTPAKVGEVLRSVLLAEAHGVPVERTASIVVADRLSDMLALLLLMSAGAFSFGLGWAVLAAGAVLCAAVIVCVQVRSVGERLVSLFSRLPIIRRAGGKLESAYESLRSLGSGRALVLPVLVSVVAWFAECLALFVIIRGLPGARIDLFTATFVYSLATVAGAVAMLPGGLGATEGSMAGMLVTLGSGLARAQAAAATLLVRLATLWFAVLVGLCALGVHRKLVARARRVGA